MHHCVLGEVDERCDFCSTGRGAQVKHQLSEEHSQNPGGCSGAVDVAREELHSSLGSSKLCATGGHVQLAVLWEYTIHLQVYIHNILGKCRWW